MTKMRTINNNMSTLHIQLLRPATTNNIRNNDIGYTVHAYDMESRERKFGITTTTDLRLMIKYRQRSHHSIRLFQRQSRRVLQYRNNPPPRCFLHQQTHATSFPPAL